MNSRKNWFIFSYLAVPVSLYFIFVLVPYLGAMAISLTRWTGTSTLDKIEFRGLQSFQRILSDEKFWSALSHNLLVLIVMPVCTLALALLFAALFTQGLKGGKFFRIVFFFPQVMSVAIVAIVWGFVFHPTMGILNGVLILAAPAFGMAGSNFPWLGNVSTVLPSVIAVAIWQAVGFYMVLFIAGMQGIPEELYEVSRIDGASALVQFWSITIPLLWETIRTAVVFLTIAAMDMYTYVTILTNGSGGPSRSADVLSTYMVQQAFGGGNNSNPFGYGTAIGVVLLLIILMLSGLGLRVTRREVTEF